MGRQVVAIAVLVAFTSACTPQIALQAPTLPIRENVPEPNSPAIEEPEAEVDLRDLPDFPAQPILKDSKALEDGILYSPRHAAECSLDAAGATRWKAEAQAHHVARLAENILHERYTTRLEDRIEDLEEVSWWDEHGTATMFGAGSVLGTLTAIAIFAVSVKIKDSSE